MSNPEGLNEHGLYTYPITYTADLPEVAESNFTIVLKIYCQGKYDGQTICTRLMIQEFQGTSFRVFGLLEEWIRQEGYWAVPNFSLEIRLQKPDDNGRQVLKIK